MLKVVASEKFQHFVCTLTLGSLVLLSGLQTADVVEAEIVVVLLHVVAIVRNRAQTGNKLSIHYARLCSVKGKREVNSSF